MTRQGKRVILGLAAAGFLLGRASVFGVLWPFGPAFLAVASRYQAGAAVAVAIASALGGFSAGGFWPGLSQVLFGGLYILAAYRGVAGLPQRWLLVLGLASALGYGVPALGRNPAPYGLLLVIFQCGLAVFLGLLFDLGLRSSLLRGRAAGNAGDRVGVLVLAGGCLAGLGGLRAGPIDLQAAAMAVWLWLAARFGGNGAGAAAGLTAGTIQVLGGAGDAMALGTHGLAGLLGGLGREFGRWGILGGIGLGYGLAGLLAGEPRFGEQLAGIAAGLALAMLLPAEALAGWLDASCGVARGDPRAGGGPGGSPASGRLQGLAQVFTELSRSFQELAVAEPLPPPEQELSMLVSRLSGQVCHGCPRYDACWRRSFFDRYRMVVELFARVEAGAGEEPPDWREKCLQPDVVAREAAHLVELRDLDRRWRRKLGESRDLMAGHLAGLARVLEDLAREVRGEGSEAPEGVRPPRLGYSTEVAKLARDGRLVCGDSHLIKELPGDRLLLVLSDGMGAGDRAAGESRTAIGLLERLIDAGFDRKVAIRTVNSILVLRSPDECFATLDLALVDLRSGEAEFIKVGASPSFIRGPDGVAVVKACSLPLGILDDVEMESSFQVLRPGDALVMMTDGVLEAREEPSARESWIQESILEAGASGEPGLARQLLDAAAGGTPAGRRDDMTVLVVRFWG